MGEIEEKLPCAFGLKDDCQARHFIRQVISEQNAAMKIPPQSSADVPREMTMFMQGFASIMTKMFQSMSELQTLSNFCMACVRLREGEKRE